MKRSQHWLFVALLAGMVLAIPRESYALIGLIEKMSGPGKFFGAQFPLDRLACIVTRNGEKHFVQTLFPPSGGVVGQSRGGDDTIDCITNHPRRVTAFVSAELVSARTLQNDLFGEGNDDPEHRVGLFGAKAVFFWRWRGIDAGAGFGAHRYSGRDFTAFWVPVVPLQLRIVPANFLAEPSRFQAFYLAVQGDFILSALDAADFGAEGTWSEDKDFVRSIFLGIDLLRFVR